MLGEISFAGKTAYNIRCNETKASILRELEDVHKTKIIQRHHERFTDGHIQKLSSNPYLVTVRTNGNPYLVFLTRINLVNQCVLIDKKVQQGYSSPRMIIARFGFDDDLFDGTLLDGEMVSDSGGKWIFLVGDIFTHRGNHMNNVDVVRRINLVYDILGNMFRPDAFDVCGFQVKSYFSYEDIGKMLTEFVPSLPYTCRGVYFKPSFLRHNDILYNFDDSLIKNVCRQKLSSVEKPFLEMQDVQDVRDVRDTKQYEKPPQPPKTNTVSKTFFARRTGLPDVFILEDPKTKINIGTACIPTMDASRFMRALFRDKNINDRIEIECYESTLFGKWIPMVPSSS
jgi:hypothetical protein